MTFCQPGEKLTVRARPRTGLRNKWRPVAEQRGGAEGIVFIHPLGPAYVLKNIRDGAMTSQRRSRPIFFSYIVQVGDQGVRGIAFECFLDETGERIDGQPARCTRRRLDGYAAGKSSLHRGYS